MQSSQPPRGRSGTSSSSNALNTSHTHYLFPAQGKYSAYSITELLFKDNITHARVGCLLPKQPTDNEKLHSATKSQTFDADAAIQILPNGFFFRLAPRVSEQRLVCLSQVSTLGKRCLTNGVDMFIDTSMAAMLSEKDELAICGVNTVRDRVYKYTFTNTDDEIHITSAAICVYDGAAENKKIAAIAGCPNLNNNFLVISFTDGEVVAGSVVDNKFVRCFSPRFANKKDGPVQLLSSPNGAVVLYQPDNDDYMVCKFSYNGNLNHKVDYAGTTLIKTNTALSHLSLAPNGNTLSGLQADNALIAHLYDTHNGTHHELKLAKPVSGLVISGNDDVAVMVHDPLDTGHETRAITILGKLDKVLETKQDVPVMITLTKQVSKFHFNAVRQGHSDLPETAASKHPFSRSQSFGKK